MMERKIVVRFLILTLYSLLCVATFSIPVFYESQTLWYKIGIDKTLLLIGQFVGLATALLVLTQVVLGTRGKFLENIFGVASLLRCHRINGLLIGLLGLGHVALVLIPEGLANLPIGKKYWPEMVGGALLWVLLVMAISSHFREQFKLDYRRWKTIHRGLGYSALLLLLVHICFVSDSFEHTVPRMGLFVTFFVVSSWVAIQKALIRFR